VKVNIEEKLRQNVEITLQKKQIVSEFQSGFSVFKMFKNKAASTCEMKLRRKHCRRCLREIKQYFITLTQK